ncbi:MAG: ABC transporter ATP-binding protein [Xanthomonadaceae bacterium]|nr:ABC transporter ATP-binding protein [Xanthomonadaceae bacterium]
MFGWFERLIDPFAPGDGSTPPAKITGFYWHYLRQVRGLLLAVCFVGFFVALIEVSLFDYVGRLVDLATESSSPADFFRDNGRLLLWMAVVVVVLRPLFLLLHDMLVNQALLPSFTARVRWQQHRYVVKQSLGFFQNDYAGRIANRIMQTGASLRESTVQIVDAIWYVTIYTLTALVLFARTDWRLTVPLILWLVGYVGLMAYFVPRTKQRSLAASQAKSKFMGRVVDGYTNIATLKLFPHAAREDDYVRESLVENVDKVRGMTRLTTTMDFSVTALNGLLIAGMGGLGLWLWHQSAISVGAVAFATGLAIRISNMSGWIMWVVNGIFEAIGTVQDGMETVAQPQQVRDKPDAQPLVVTRGDIRFEDIEFHYGKEGGVISGLNLEIKPGEKVGLVGPSGAGKTTLVNVLLRMYDLEDGRILIDGQDIADVTQDSLRSQIGVVTQDTALLHRSIRDNLLYGRPDATESDIEMAVQDARADAFIVQLADGEGRHGYEAQVGERGVKLSGGQRQRIAIARVLLKDAPILVLDEATSALDSEVEAAIQDSLDRLMQGKTVLAIAHRLSTIARMDRLVVMDKGRIVETGTHAELIKAEGLYARLWQRQTGGFVAAADDAALDTAIAG